MLNASLFSAAILPLSTAYVTCEAFGWEAGVDHGWREAPIFSVAHYGIVGDLKVVIPKLIRAVRGGAKLTDLAEPRGAAVVPRPVGERG